MTCSETIELVVTIVQYVCSFFILVYLIKFKRLWSRIKKERENGLATRETNL